MMGDVDTSVLVALRIRPQSASEKIEMCRICTNVTPNHPQVILGKDKAFTYDRVFDTDSRQFEIYRDCIENLIEGCFDGYNATVLAYGQTGSGKTYTMGTGFDVNISKEGEGVIPRAVAHLFNGIEKRMQVAQENAEPLPDFKVLVQFMELYNEDLVDLFDGDNRESGKHIKIHEDPNGGIYTVGVTMKPVSSAKETLICLQQGALSRTTASTNMNAQSSRSHAVFTLHITQQRIVKLCDDDEVMPNGVQSQSFEYEMLTAKFNFVDLAGSERLKRTGATGDRAKEGISINCGLLALGNVISALGDKAKKGSHVPYRDSKLTRLLQDSLGGNSRTLMIACVSPSDRDFMETLNTLKYANRARNIKNKVVVNQDKASRQIATLRAEIQGLTMEINEYKQGKRVAGEGEEHMSDMYHENTMLQTENDKLRMRIKALDHTVQDQKSRITDFMAKQGVALLNGELKGGVEELIGGYVKEIEELRSRLVESEAMASAVARRSVMTASRMARTSIEEPTMSILELAKQDLNQQVKKAKVLEKNLPFNKNNDEFGSDDDDKESEEESNSEDDEDELNEDDEDKNESESCSDESDEDLDEEEEREEREENKGAELLREGLTELSTEITIKQKLIEELELSQKRLNNMKSHYEDKLTLLQCQIKETEIERDRVLQTIQQHDKAAEQHGQKVKDDYEKKINQFKNELKSLQAAKKEHNKLLRTKTQNENQLKNLTRELDDMKKMRVKLMRQMKDEVAKGKQKEAERVRQISQLKKESRKRDLHIKNMESEKKQRELILKRKQQEVKHLRQQQKPISGKLGKQRKNLPLVLEPGFSSTATMVVSGTGVEKPDKTNTLSQRNTRVAKTTRASGIPTLNGSGKIDKVIGKVVPSPRRRVSTSQASKAVKKTWGTIEKQIEHIVVHHQTMFTMESEMERWMKDRDGLSKRIETCNKKLEEAKANKDENTTRDCNEQLEAFKAHMDYVQENISEAQTELADLEEEGQTTEITEAITKCSNAESKLLMEHFLTKAIELGKETVAKDATVKELEAKLEALRQHNELQQDLLMHVLQHPSEGDVAPTAKKLETAVNGGGELMNGGLKDEPGSVPNKSQFLAYMKEELPNNTSKNANQSQLKDKARRRSATQEEYLYAKRPERRQPTLSIIQDVPDDPSTPPDNPKPPIDPVTSSDLVQKLLQLEKARKEMNKNDTSLMVPPLPERSKGVSSTSSNPQDRSNSLTSLDSLPGPTSFVRGTFKSKSARNFTRPKVPGTSSSMTLSSESRSQPTSPTLSRKSYDDKTKIGIPQRMQRTSLSRRRSRNECENVFSRLTSTLPQDANPNIGRMLPVKPPTGKPGPLVCVYASTGHNSAVLSLCVSETTMFTGSKDRTVKIWDLNTGEETMSLGPHKRDVTSLKYCSETKKLFSVSQNIIKIWDIRSPPGKCIKTIISTGTTNDSTINDLTVNHYGTHVFAANGNTVKIWDLNNYQMVGKLGGHAGHVMTLLLLGSEEPYLVLTGSRDHYIKLFELTGSLSGVQAVVPARSNSSYKKRSKDLFTSKTPIQTFEPPHYDGVQSLALQGNNLFSGSRDNSIKKWDLSTQQVQQNLISAHKDWVCSLDFLRSHNVLLSGCRAGVLKLWEPETCHQVGEIKAHRHPINAIATNSSFVFTASSDRLIRVWKATDVLEEKLREIPERENEN